MFNFVSIYNNNLKTYFMGKQKKPVVFAFDFDEFIVRVTNERVDLEDRGKTWKTCFFPPSTGYMLIAKLLVPQAFPHDPGCAEILKSEAAIKESQRNVKEIARCLFITGETLCADPISLKEMYEVFKTSIDRRTEHIKKASTELTLEEQAILAEEKALADPTEENIEAARVARELAENPPKKAGKTKKKK